MPISLSLADVLPDGLEERVRSEGTFGDDVVVQFLCNTGPGGEHDPNASPDDRVRPSHAAFHGRIFEMGEAPVPPLDYGCRCAIRYMARPKTQAAKVLSESTDEDAITPVLATKDWLEDNVKDWRHAAEEAKGQPAIKTMTIVREALKTMGVPQPQSIAEMVVDVLRAGEAK